jgi:hypothetical protein
LFDLQNQFSAKIFACTAHVNNEGAPYDISRFQAELFVPLKQTTRALESRGSDLSMEPDYFSILPAPSVFLPADLEFD